VFCQEEFNGVPGVVKIESLPAQLHSCLHFTSHNHRWQLLSHHPHHPKHVKRGTQGSPLEALSYMVQNQQSEVCSQQFHEMKLDLQDCSLSESSSSILVIEVFALTTFYIN
jgi:hypothetical protein